MASIQSIRSSLDGIVVKLIVGVIIIAFVGSIGWSVFFSSTDVNVVAIVDDHEIDINDLNFEMRAQNFYFQERFKDQDLEIDEETLQKVSIESLIRKSSILNFLSDSSLIVTDNVAYLELSKDESFQEDGRFSLSKFEAVARSQGYIPSTYLNRIKDDLAMSFWRNGIGGSSFTNNKEIDNNLRLAEQTRDIDFVRFKLDDLLAKTDAAPADIKEFYESNNGLFPTKKLVKLKYIILSAKELRKNIEVTEELLQEEYAVYLESFDNSIRKTVSHLMINIDGDTTADDALILAQSLFSEIKEGSNFTDLVKKYSDDEGTKDTGGDLGVTDGSVLPPEFENAIASMKEGEISLPVELEDSVHLLMVTKIQKPIPLTYENKRDLISDTIKEDLANNEFIGLLDQISDLTFSLNEIDAIGKEFNLLVQSADYFSKDSVPQNLDRNKILELLFENVEFINNPSVELLETGEGEAFVLYLEDSKSETIKPFEQVKSEAEEYYKGKLAQSNLDVIIKKIVESLDQGTDFSKIADEQAVALESYKDISRTSSLLSRPVVYDIFNLPRANIETAHGASRLENGDAIVYKLKAVNEKQSETTTEDKESFKGFINEERNISELSELQVTSQNAAVIIRKF